VSDELLRKGTAALERIAAVLAALYGDSMGDINQGNKAERLSRLGLSSAQIADALGTTANAINVGRFKHRRKAKRGTKAARRPQTRRGRKI
jgi:hypothetical protein